MKTNLRNSIAGKLENLADYFNEKSQKGIQDIMSHHSVIMYSFFESIDSLSLARTPNKIKFYAQKVAEALDKLRDHEIMPTETPITKQIYVGISDFLYNISENIRNY